VHRIVVRIRRRVLESTDLDIAVVVTV